MKIKWKRNIFKQYWWPKQEKGDEGKCGPFCCAIVAQIVKPKLKRKWLSKELESCHDWLTAREIIAFLGKLGIKSIPGGSRDLADTTDLERELNIVSKRNPLIVSCVGRLEGQNHWVVVAEKRGEKVRVIDPKCGPIWATFDGFKPKYMKREMVYFAGKFVKIV